MGCIHRCTKQIYVHDPHIVRSLSIIPPQHCESRSVVSTARLTRDHTTTSLCGHTWHPFSLLFLLTDIPSEIKCDQVSPMCNSLKSLWPLHTPPATQCLCDHALFTHETGTICCRIVDIFAQISSNSAHKGTSNPEIQQTSKIPVAVLVQWYWTTLTKSLHPRVWPNGSQC